MTASTPANQIHRISTTVQGRLVAHSLDRAREIGVRKTLGAHRWQLTTRFLGEAIITSLLAGGVAGVLFSAASPAFNNLFIFTLMRIDAVDASQLTEPVVLGLIAFACIGTGPIAGLYPALRLSGFQPSRSLKGQGKSLSGSSRLRKGLIAGQIIFSLVFLVTAATFFQQTRYMANADHELRTERLVSVALEDVSYESFRDAVDGLPDVEMTAAVSHLMLGPSNYSSGDILLPGETERTATSGSVQRIRTYFCKECEEAISIDRIEKRQQRGKSFIRCDECDAKVSFEDVIEKMFGSDEAMQKVRLMDREAERERTHERLTAILNSHAASVSGKAGIYEPSDPVQDGIDGRIKLFNSDGEPTGEHVHLHLLTDNTSLRVDDVSDRLLMSATDGSIEITNHEHTDAWRDSSKPVMLVVQMPGGDIDWMNVTAYLRSQHPDATHIAFDGQPFTSNSVRELAMQHRP